MAQIVGYPGAFGDGDSTHRTNTTGNPPVPLGTVGYDSAGNEYRFVRAGGTITAGQAVQVTQSTTPFDQVVVTSGANQFLAGAADAAFAANDCGFVVRNGVVAGVTGGTLTAGTPKTTAAAGALADAAAADINNAVAVMLVAASSTAYILGV